MNTIIEVPGPEQPLKVRQVHIPEAPPKGFVLKTHYAGICHSDVHIATNKIRLSDNVVVGLETLNPSFKWPHIMGHEFCGEVYKLGEDIKESKGELKVGDRVCVFSFIGCGSCGFCTTGNNVSCDKNMATDYGIGSPGGFQSYFPVQNKDQVVKIPDGLASDKAAILGCSGITAYTGVKHALPVVELAMKCKGNASVLVIGAGGLGLWGISLGKTVFPKGTQIYVADIDESKLDAAKVIGADSGLLWSREMSDEDAIQATQKLTGGVDVTMDFVGITSTANRGFKVLNKNGRLLLIGVGGGELHLSVLDAALACKSVIGIYAGDFSDFKELVHLVHEKKVQSPPINYVSPEGANDALNQLAKGQITGRCVIRFTQ